MAPNQPTQNMQDDLSPEESTDAETSGGKTGGGFEMLQRSYRAGGVVPDYPADEGTVVGKTEGNSTQS